MYGFGRGPVEFSGVYSVEQIYLSPPCSGVTVDLLFPVPISL